MKKSISVLLSLAVLSLNFFTVTFANEWDFPESNCWLSLWDMVSGFDKETVFVSTYLELKNAVDEAYKRKNQDKWFEIVLKKWTYNLSNWLWTAGKNIIFRWETGNPEDVVLKWKWMQWWVTHGIWATNKNIFVWDLSIWNVRNHAVQVHWELWADNFLLHNTNIFDTWEQMIKWTTDRNNSELMSKNWIVQCSHFEYTNKVWPQWYIWGIDVHGGKDWIVRDNTFKYIVSPTSALAEHAIHFWTNSEWTVVERNKIYNCDRWIWFGLWSSAHKGWIIRNNLIYHDSSKGDVWIGLENADWAKVYNNTIFLENSYPNSIEYRFPGTNVEIRNNLTNKSIEKRNSWKAVLSNNYEDATKEIFVDVSRNNFNLNSKAWSAVDKWIYITELNHDIEKNERDDKIDIWAYEYKWIEPVEQGWDDNENESENNENENNYFSMSINEFLEDYNSWKITDPETIQLISNEAFAPASSHHLSLLYKSDKLTHYITKAQLQQIDMGWNLVFSKYFTYDQLKDVTEKQLGEMHPNNYGHLSPENISRIPAERFQDVTEWNLAMMRNSGQVNNLTHYINKVQLQQLDMSRNLVFAKYFTYDQFKNVTEKQLSEMHPNNYGHLSPENISKIPAERFQDVTAWNLAMMRNSSQINNLTHHITKAQLQQLDMSRNLVFSKYFTYDQFKNVTEKQLSEMHPNNYSHLSPENVSKIPVERFEDVTAWNLATMRNSGSIQWLNAEQIGYLRSRNNWNINNILNRIK